LHQISQTVSERIYDVFLGRPGAPIFVFEGEEQEVLDEAPYDSPALIKRCKLQNVYANETSSTVRPKPVIEGDAGSSYICVLDHFENSYVYTERCENGTLLFVPDLCLGSLVCFCES
jgi:hypothetical protein